MNPRDVHKEEIAKTLTLMSNFKCHREAKENQNCDRVEVWLR